LIQSIFSKPGKQLAEPGVKNTALACLFNLNLSNIDSDEKVTVGFRQKPLFQLYAIVIDDIEESKKKSEYFEQIQKKFIDEGVKYDKCIDKIQSLKEEEVKQTLFDPVLIKINNIKNKNQEITKWFKPKNT
jgi:hypothetical protein